jgi:uncharacterized protein YjdB
VGAATTLADITSPGTWASGTVGIAAVGPSSGIVSGVLAGLATITYTATSTGCIKTVQVTINPLPATTITPSSSTTICMGDSTSFTAFAPQPAFNILLQDFNSGLGAWTLVNTSGNAASYWQVTSTPATSITGDGTAMLEANSDLAYSSASVPLTTILVSPSFSTVGYGTATVSFNEYLVSAPSDDNVDVDYSINGGSTWTNISGQVGVGFSSPGGGTGSWTSSGTPEVSLSLPAAALDQPDVKLRWHYNANAGLYWDIDNIKVTAYQPAVTYAWSGVAGATGLSCSSCGTPTITPAATGSNIYSVTSTTSASCQSTLGVTVSVNPSPAAITGASAVCVNSTITLADADAGGTWSSGEATVSVDATSGVVTGVSAGPATISYSLATGCAKTMAITVNPLPAAITGVMQVCEGLTTSLSSTTGGTWGATVPGVATIDVNTGVVSGIDAGTSSITYTLTATGCAISTTVTVNDAPAAITGTMHVCEGLTTTLGDTDAGGTWASGTTSIATVEGASGVVTAIDEGATTITYQAPGGCISTAIVTVDPLPAAITGIMQVCEGLTTTLSSTTSGGTWSIGTASVATVGATTGIVSGDVMGTAGVDYTLTATGCAISATVTVNHTPVAITGDLQVCAGLTTTLTNTDGGGTWTSGTTVVATIGNATGVVSAIADGTTTITYQLPAGCITTADVTVNPLPAAITGVMQVCQGLTTALDNFTTGGAWSSGSINASVDASGVVTGSTAGVETITYQLPTTCLQTADVTVNPTPAVITGMMEVCEGLTTALSNGDAGGTWTSGATVTVTVDATTGVVTGIDDGVATITYRLPTTCINTADVTVNPLPAAITGATQVCVGLTTTLGNTSGGGTWSNTPGAAIIDGSGVVLGMSDGITTITYTLPTGCIITTDVTVNPLPAAINGTMQVCAGLTATLSDATTGGTWSSGPSLAAAVDATGIVTASTAGNTMITYTLPTSCIATAEVTVNPLPHTIAGTRAVCEGLTTALSDADAGGTWLSSITTVASIDASGVVSGILAGTTSITYTLPTGCIISSDVTVNPLPAPITGTMQVCAGLTTTLASITPAGTWSSGAPATATVGVSTGVVSASVEGVATITYALPTGCLTSAEVTVNPLPAAIVGSLQVCLGAATSLTNASAGGTWSTSAVVASINATTGVANGIAIGNSTITYTLPTSCKMTAGITVNPLPAPITGPSQFCEGTAALYGNGSPGGTWSSSTILVASIDPAGEAAGNASGTTLITYTLGTGCSRVRPVTVNSLPAAITGTMQVCQAGTAMLADGTPGGSWISGNISVATINSAGLFNGMSAGTTAIYYRMPTGCMTTATVTVNQMPAAITAPGGTVICEGQTTTLANTVAGGSWISNAATIASVDPVTGVVTGVSAGSAYITYMLPEGCSRAVAISVNAMPAAITGASQMCQGSTTVMTTTSTGGAWTSSATSVASINLTSGVVTGLAAGFASISYTNVAGGCTVVKSISVDPLPAALIGSSNVCEGQTTAISSTSTGGTWTSSNNTVAIVGTSGTISALGSGSSVISYQLSTGCMRSVIVTVNPSPAVYNMTGGGNYCASGSGLHVGLTNSMGGVSYQLYAGSTLVGSPVAGVTGMPLDFGTIAPAGSYSATATIAATGCTSNMAGIVTVTVTALVPASVSLSTGTGSDTVCSGIPVSFAAAATNGGTSPVYQWMVNGVVIAGATSNAYSYLPATGDVISVDMTSSIGCASPLMATAAKTMTVNTSVMPVAGIAVTPGTNLCAGNTVTFSASSLFGGSAPAFVWMKNGTTAATGATYTYTPADGDIVYVKLAGNHTCSLADTVLSSSVTMAVAPLYMPLVNITADPGTTVNVGTNVTLTANVSNGGPSPEFQWYIGTSSIVGATSANFSYNMYSDGDSVSCQVKGTGVCGFGGFNSIIMHLGGTGIAVPADMGDVRLMPNPNKGEFAVKGALAAKADKEVAIEVTNMLGQVVYKTNVMTRNGDIDAKIKLDNTLANGMYILSLISEGQKSVMHFVVEQ